jgi:hypothetical protein
MHVCIYENTVVPSKMVVNTNELYAKLKKNSNLNLYGCTGSDDRRDTHVVTNHLKGAGLVDITR